MPFDPTKKAYAFAPEVSSWLYEPDEYDELHAIVGIAAMVSCICKYISADTDDCLPDDVQCIRYTHPACPAHVGKVTNEVQEKSYPA